MSAFVSSLQVCRFIDAHLRMHCAALRVDRSLALAKPFTAAAASDMTAQYAHFSAWSGEPSTNDVSGWDSLRPAFQ